MYITPAPIIKHSQKTEGLFSQVDHIDFGRYSPEEKISCARYLAAVQDVFVDMRLLKNDEASCEFVSEEIGYDVVKGFKTLESLPLRIFIDTDIKKFNDSLFSNTAHEKLNHFSLESSIYSIENCSAQNLKTLAAHEISHAILYGSVESDDVNSQGHTNSKLQIAHYSMDHIQNFCIEIAADKLAVASNPDNNIGLLLTDIKNSNTWANRAYHQGFIPEKYAQKLSDFYTSRDHLLVKTMLPYAPFPLFLLNKAFFMNCSPTHPSALTRALEANDFCERISDFQALRETPSHF